MPKQPTSSTKQLAVEIDGDVKDAIARRAKEEGRTLRALVERMARFYFSNAPADPLAADPTEPKKRRVK